MKILNFTQKLLRQRSFFSSLIPLLALFVGLGSAQSARAQALSTVASANITLDVKGTATTLDARPTTAGPANFASRDFGSFDINSDAFRIQNSVFTINEDPSENFDTGELRFRVAPGTLATVISSGFTTIPLVNAGLSGGVRTFTLTNAGRDILASVASPAGGTSQRLDITFTAIDNTNILTIGTGLRRSVFIATGTRPAPTSIGNTNVFINTTGATTPNTTYGASSGTLPLFQGANLGNYDINTGKLTLNGGNATTFESGSDVVQSTRLVYLLFKPAQGGNPAVAFPQSNIALNQVGSPTTGNGGTTRTFSSTTALRNLISGLANNGNGTYNISVSFEAVVLRGGSSTLTVRDDNGGSGYNATFTTSGTPVLIDTWTGSVSDDWFTPGNWDLGFVPTANTNVVVPDFGPGNTRPYPNINAGVVYVSQPSGVSINNTNSGPALSRDVVLQGTTQAQRSICRLIAGRWRVFGSFDNSYVSYIQRSATVFELAGSGNQTISGGAFTAIELSGGGTKNLTTLMTVAISMQFVSTNGPAGLFTTDISQPDNNYVELFGRSTGAPDGAQLLGETETGYLRGFVQTNRSDVRANEVNASGSPDPRTFGNMGLTLLFTGANNPGDVLVTRNTAESYTPLVRTGTGGSTSRFGIRRIFGVRPGSPNTSSGGLTANLTFRYLDNELTNLGPTGNGSVSEPNLALFVSTSGGNQFGFLGVDALDQVNNVLTKNGVRTFATFTLGDKTAPLPVSLTAFDAKRIGNDALVTWETATELNNKGYDVQVSTNGKEFRTIGSVSVSSPNSNAPKSYRYLDIEKNKVGQRYYRLRQVDVDGKENFYSPRVVNFEGKATETVLSAFPNPFGSADELHLSMQTDMAGAGQITVTDMTGRTISRQAVQLTSGSNDVTVKHMNDLHAGFYLVKIVLPTGETKSLKVVKQ